MNIGIIHYPKEFLTKLREYLLFYNTKRVHKALDLKSPIDYLIDEGLMSKKDRISYKTLKVYLNSVRICFEATDREGNLSGMKERIDAHSHFGKTFLGPENHPDRYLLEAEKLDIVCSVISPAPSPEFLVGGNIFRPCIWKFENGKVSYVQQYFTPREETVFSETRAGQNPYHDANWQLITQSSQINQVFRQEVKVMPIHHPFLDTESELLSLLEENCVIALKFHGIATFAGPESIRQPLIRELRTRRMPIVVHTDMFNGLPLKPEEIARELNNPVKWVKWAIDTEVPTLITHGARLSEEAINLARGLKHILIGCSPDLAIMGEKDFALGKITNNFLDSLLQMVPSDQLIFDIDYGWNVKKIGDWEDLDWDMLQRLERSATKFGLSEMDLEKICYKNAISFFRL